LIDVARADQRFEVHEQRSAIEQTALARDDAELTIGERTLQADPPAVDGEHLEAGVACRGDQQRTPPRSTEPLHDR